MTQEQGKQLRARAVRGAAYTGAQAAIVRVLSLVTFVVLARLLSQHDYGIAALAATFTIFLSTLAAGGIAQTLVQRPVIKKADVDSVFWVSVFIACALAAILIASSWAIAGFFDVPELQPAVCVLSLSLIAVGLSSTHMGLLQRKFAFHETARAIVFSNILATIVGLVIAIAGGGYWALILQSVIPPVLTCVQVWRASDYRPTWTFSREAYLETFRVSRHFLGANCITYLNQQSDKLLIGKFLGPAAVGVYAVAYRVVFVMMDVLSRSTNAVSLSSYARLQDDRERLGDAYQQVLRVTITVAMPLFVLAGTATDDVVALLFGSRWLDVVPLMRVFCLFGVLQTYLAGQNVFLQAVGRGRQVFRIGAVGAVTQIVLTLIAVRYGAFWVALTVTGRSLLAAPAVTILASRVIGGTGTLRRTARSLAAPVVASGVLGGACLYIQTSPVPDGLAQLMVSCVVTPVVYLGSLSIVGRLHLRELRDVAMVLCRRKQRAERLAS